MATYNEVRQQLGTGPEDDGFATLISGELPDGTSVQSPTIIYGTRNPLTTPTPIVWEMDNVGPWGVTIDVGHHQRHEGDSFGAVYVDSTLASAETMVVHVHAPAGCYPHFMYQVTCPLAFTIALYKDPTIDVTGYGTAITPLNHNQNVSLAPEMKVYHTPITTGNGTLMEQFYIGGGQQRAGGAQRSVQEWILQAGHHYLLIVTSRENSNSGAIVLDWYEEGVSA